MKKEVRLSGKPCHHPYLKEGNKPNERTCMACGRTVLYYRQNAFFMGRLLKRKVENAIAYKA